MCICSGPAGLCVSSTTGRRITRRKKKSTNNGPTEERARSYSSSIFLSTKENVITYQNTMAPPPSEHKSIFISLFFLKKNVLKSIFLNIFFFFKMKLTARCDSDGGPDEMAGIDEIAGSAVITRQLAISTANDKKMSIFTLNGSKNVKISHQSTFQEQQLGRTIPCCPAHSSCSWPLSPPQIVCHLFLILFSQRHNKFTSID